MYELTDFIHIFEAYFVYAPSQWEMRLHCNLGSLWKGAYTKWSCIFHWHQSHHIIASRPVPLTFIHIDRNQLILPKSFRLTSLALGKPLIAKCLAGTKPVYLALCFIQYMARIRPWYSQRGLHICITWLVSNTKWYSSIFGNCFDNVQVHC